MDSIGIIIFLKFFFNYMITKIDNYEIKHQLNTDIFF